MTKNPLDSFKRNMIEFTIHRSDGTFSSVKGLKNTENSTNKKYIGFYPNVDIQIGDVITCNDFPIKYYVIDVDTATYLGKIFQIKAYYETQAPQQKNQNSTVYNIKNAPNSIIGNQQNATQNNYVSDIESFKHMIEQYGANDKARLYELSKTLELCLEKDEFQKSKLSKFSDLLAKHSWLPTAITQLICTYISK